MRLSFTLPPSCYATMCLRELTKQSTELGHQLALGVAADTAAAAAAAAAPVAAAPVAAVSPAPVAAAAQPVDWATGFELPKAPSAAEYNAPATLPVPPTVVQTPVVAQEYNAPVAEYNAPTTEYAAPTMPVVAGASP